MAIVFNCPYCATPYNLKDEYAGKKATCRNGMCRKVITVPQAGNGAPSTNGAAPPAPPVDVEAAALSALADNPAEKAGAQDIPMTCEFCGHKWAEPVAKAGKNVLCQNSECRQRMKVPVPKDHTPADWREGGTKGPSLAKQNFEKPADIMDVASAGIVSRDTLKKADATNEEIEPRPLKQKVMFVLIPLLVLGGIGFGIYSWITSGRERKQDNLVVKAIQLWDETDEGSKPPAAEVPLCAALLRMAAGEYDVRQNEKGKFKEGFDNLNRARDLLKQAAQKDNPKAPTAAGERNVLLGELAVATLVLGGTEEQAKAETRYRWQPETAAGPKHQRIKDEGSTVHKELSRTLDLLRTADFDTKTLIVRRLTRELVKRGQANLADTLHTMLFDPSEVHEAHAIIALEIYRLDRTSDLPRRIADEVKGAKPTIPSPTTLFKVLGITDKAALVGEPPAAGVPGDQACLAYTGLYLLQEKPDEAVRLALRGGKPEVRLRALALCAEWLDDPGPAVEAAVSQVTVKKKELVLPQVPIFRLSQRAAEAGKADTAKALADALTDEGLKAWAKAEVGVARLRPPPSSKDPADEAAAEVPDDPRKMRVAHAWARLLVARQNARVGPWKDQKFIAGWPAAVQPFGLAGIALGLQDREATGP
jgi:hypothetical protein